jgi:hypothetical protein
MLLRTHNAGIELQRNQVISLCDAAGLEIRVTRGTLWLTQEDDTRDRVLNAGDHHFVSNAGLTVLSALNGRAVVVATQKKHRVARRWLAVLLHWVRPSLRLKRNASHPIAALHGA